MTPDDILATLTLRYDGTTVAAARGERSVFYNPGAILPRGVYFATVKEADGENDRASKLGNGRFRFNLGLPKPQCEQLFGAPPPRPSKGDVILGTWDFRGTDILTPHPVYGWMGWVSVVNPSNTTFVGLTRLIDAAFAKAKAAFNQRVQRA